MYKVNEIFQTIQGEGSYTGTPSIFVRLQGCPVGCPWCDTKHTWEVDPELLIKLEEVVSKRAESDHWSQMQPQQLIDLINEKEYTAKHIVITGGEPCMYDLNPLCELLHEHGFTTQIETSGTFKVFAPESTWVTVSPKVDMKGGYEVCGEAMTRADEIKHPVAMEKHVEELEVLLDKFKTKTALIYLQPISQKPKATRLAIDACIKRNWRLSIQTHKYLGIE